MWHRFINYFAVFCWLTPVPLFSQPASFHFETLTINNGLSQGFISSIVQDMKGFMWFGTSDGLDRYDGYSFTVYRHDFSDSASIAENKITCVFEDSKERLWVCTEHSGLDLFDRENLVFIHFKSTGGNSLPSDDITGITEDKTGGLWVSTQKGICRMLILENKQATNKNGDFFSSNSIHFNVVTNSTLDADLQLYNKPPLVFIDSRNNIFLTSHNSIWQCVIKPGGWACSLLYKLASNPETMERFPPFARLFENTASHCRYLHLGGQIFRLRNNSLDSLEKMLPWGESYKGWLIDKQNNLWLNTLNGLEYTNLSTLQKSKVVSDNREINKLLCGANCLYVDRAGIIWVGTIGFGIVKFNPQQQAFHSIVPDIPSYRLYKTARGTLILNSKFELTIKDGELVNADTLMYHEAEDGEGNYWALQKGYLLKYNPATKKSKPFFFDSSKTAYRQTNLIFSDRQKNFWFGYKGALVKFNENHGFTQYRLPVNFPKATYFFLYGITEDKNGDLWLATAYGLFHFFIHKESWESFVHRENAPSSLRSNTVLCTCVDPLNPEKFLWAGTNGGGLNRVDKATGKFICYTDKDGLPNNVVYGILPDRQGNLWLSTNNGIAHFINREKKFVNYSANDGLQGNEFNSYSYFGQDDGTLIFGGINGLTYFKPEEVKEAVPPPVIITGFRLFNKDANYKQPGSTLTKDILYTKEIKVRYDQNMLTFLFASTDYHHLGSPVYRYRLKGFDKDWVIAGTVREATYTNLDPGSYTFMVQASNREGNWGFVQTILPLTVAPLWWQTWWFYLATVMLFVVLVYLIYRYRISQLLQMQLVRNGIARDLHDQIGSSLSTISIYSSVAQEKNRNDGGTSELLKNIRDNAVESMEAMSDIVWSVNTRNDSFENIINRMREHAIALFEAKGYGLHFSFDDKLNSIKLSMEKRKEFYLIYKEALNNIAKYANCQNVWVAVDAVGAVITLTIKDDGQGFNTANPSKKGNGLFNMQARAAALKGHLHIIAEEGAGTEITLVFRKWTGRYF